MSIEYPNAGAAAITLTHTNTHW